MVYIALYVAMAIALDFVNKLIPFNEMPTGGSFVNLALIPLVIGSWHLGIKKGFLMGILWWLISSFFGLNPYYLNIVQYSLDYIIPALAVGLVGIYNFKKNLFFMEFGIFLMSLVRFFSTLLSGAYFWLDNTASGSFLAWLNSLKYNFPYNFSCMIFLMIICPLVFKRIDDKLIKALE